MGLSLNMMEHNKMARSKNVQGYSSWYKDILEAVLDSQEPFLLETSDEKQAKLKRFEFYDFIKACRAQPQFVHDDIPNKFYQIGQGSYSLIFRVSGSTLIIQKRETSKESKELEDSFFKYLEKIGKKKDEEPPEIIPVAPRVPPHAPDSSIFGDLTPKKEIKDPDAAFNATFKKMKELAEEAKPKNKKKDDDSNEEVTL
jgi:hypothetical protein